MYAIYLNKPEEMHAVYYALQVHAIPSRFTFEIDREQGSTVHKVIIRNVRLKKSKHYCGNHAGPCQINPAFHRPHRKAKWLEGADWVAFNDMVNDLLDEMGVDVRRVKSSTCLIRKGNARCIEYKGKDGADFDKVGVYANRIGQPTKAKYPAGTPGIDSWRA